jgi:hypothetical protein
MTIVGLSLLAFVLVADVSRALWKRRHAREAPPPAVSFDEEESCPYCDQASRELAERDREVRRLRAEVERLSALDVEIIRAAQDAHYARLGIPYIGGRA